MIQEVTNEELARMIAEGFAQTATKQQLEVVEGRLGEVEGRLGEVEGRLEDMDRRLGIVERKLDRVLYDEITDTSVGLSS